MSNLFEKISKFLTKEKLIFILCLIFLSYQVCELFKQYFDVNLVTNIKFVKNEPESLPAITICYDELYSYEKISKRFPNSLANEKYKNFSMFMKKFRDVDIYKWNISEGLPNEITILKRQYREILYEINRLIYKSNSKIHSVYHDMFDNMTLPYIYEEDNVTMKIIQLEFIGKVFGDGRIIFEYNDEYKTYSPMLNTLECIVNNEKKCFTFLNNIQQEYKNIKVITDQYTLLIYYPKNMFPVNENRKISIAIHSPNEMPNLGNFFDLDQAHHIKINYMKTQVDQNAAYTQCQHYDQHDKYEMYSDCLINCMTDLLTEYCITLLELFILIKYPIRRNLLRSMYPVYNCSSLYDLDKRYRIMKMQCSQICIEDCHQEYFYSDTILTNQFGSDSIFKIFNKLSIVEITSSDKPSIMINHFPEMSLISLLCNLGGLTGMWLGVSIASTLTDLADLAKILRRRFPCNCFNNINGPTIIFNFNSYIFKRKRQTIEQA